MTTQLTAEQCRALGSVSRLYQVPELAETPHSNTTLRFGLIADPQYADAAPARRIRDFIATACVSWARR